MNLPNALTVSRVALVPMLATALLAENLNAALAIFVLGMATDTLDGHIARTRGLITDFGKLMDPVADKLFVGTAFVCLVLLDRIELAVVVVILSREVAVSALRLVASRRGVVLSANKLGKAKTTLQAITVGVLIIGDPELALTQLLVALTVFVTILSGMAYFFNWATASGAPGEPASSPG